MLVQDVMTRQVIGTIPLASIATAAKLMVDHKISGLPVVDASYHVLGMITEGDLLRRSELGTEAKRAEWWSFFASSGKLADEYAHSRGRRVEEVMSSEPVTIAAGALLNEAVELMLKHHIKRLPVISGQGQLIGIISRSDLVRTLLGAMPERAGPASDEQIRQAIAAELKGQPWTGVDNIRIGVRDGVVELEGTVFDERQRTAIKVASENALGVKQVVDHLVWIEPMSGLVVMAPNDQPPAQPADGSKAA